MAKKPMDVLSIVEVQGFAFFLIHSELWGWPHLCAELDGNGFFLEFTSWGNFSVEKNEKNSFKKVLILTCFLVKNSGGGKWA